MKRNLTRPRLALAVLALALVVAAWVAVLSTRAGLTVRRFVADGVPMTYMAPRDATKTPGILIAHGFGGSRQLMMGYGTVLAQAGYAVLLWDFGGHAANPARLDQERDALQDNLNSAYESLTDQPEVDPARIGLLGHSMGAGAVLRAGVADPDRYAATVAVSGGSDEVTPALPRNLMLQAGQWESRFVARARETFAQAGGPSTNFGDGTARSFLIVPRVEHILILFSRLSQEEALGWYNQAFGLDRPPTMVDRRLAWFAVQVVAALLLLTAVAPALPRPKAGGGRRRRLRAILGLALAPILATGLLYGANLVLDVSGLGGILVGGALALWFFFLGTVWLLLGFVPARPTGRALLGGLILFAFLWLAFGPLAQLVWLPWLLIPDRLVWWPLLALLCVPWLLAAGQATTETGKVRRFLWWLGQTVFIAAGVLLLLNIVPGMGVLILVLPLLPVMFAIMAVAGAVADHPWSYAVGNALFFGWVLLVYFPLAG